MPWVRFDDDFPDHWKIEPLSDGAYRLHTTAIFRSSKWLTDGYLPKNRLDLVAPRRMKRPGKYVTELETAGLWEPAEDGWMLHDFLDYQPSKAQVTAERKKTAERQKRWRERHAETRDDSVSHGGSNGVTNGGSNAAPTRPDPPRPYYRAGEDTPPSPRKRGQRLPDDFTVSEDMREWARENTPNIGQSEHDKFCDYWRAQPGQKGVKADWVATWRNWMRRAQETAPSNVVAIRGDRMASKKDMLARQLERAEALDALEELEGQA